MVYCPQIPAPSAHLQPGRPHAQTICITCKGAGTMGPLSPLCGYAMMKAIQTLHAWKVYTYARLFYQPDA